MTKFSSKIGDVIEGNFLIDLAGWKGCHCGCCDDDGNYIVDCSTVRIDLSFKVVVGSLDDEPNTIININDQIW